MHPRDYIVKFCDDLKRQLLDKYNKGEAEHGMDFGQVDCIKEVNLEVLDVLNYMAIHRAQQDLKNGNAK